MRKIVSLLSVLTLFYALAYGQTRTVTGKVVDAQGKPVPFASVLIKGTNSGVSADANGAFTIDAAPNTVLVFSAAGYQSAEINIGTRTSVNVSLSNQSSMSEVIVTALGIQRSKNTLPFAAQVISGAEVSNSRSANFLSGLSGQVAGLSVTNNNTLGGSTNIVLRGYKSISGSNQALIVVDGVPYDNTSNHQAGTNISGTQRTGRGGYDYGNDAADINPDNIESVTVLKGAAASALYGSRAFNGVILITTKKAKRGLGITVNSGVTMLSVDKSTFPTYQNKYGGGYGKGYYEDPSGFFLYRDINGDGVKDLVDPTSEDASYGAPFDPNLLVYQWDAFDPTSPYYLKARPWVAAAHNPIDFFEKPVNFTNSVFVTEGDDKSSFKIGYTRNDDKGILPNSKIVKNALNLFGSYNLNKQLTVTGEINYTNTDGKGRYGTGYGTQDNVMSSFRQWWQVNNDILELKDAYFRTGKNVTWNWADPTDIEPIYWNNIYFVRYQSYETDNRNRYNGYAKVDYKLNDHFSLMGRATMDLWDELIEERVAVGNLEVPTYSKNLGRQKDVNYDLLFSYDNNEIAKDLGFRAIAGGNIHKQSLQNTFASTNGGLIVPKLYALSNSLNQMNPPIEFDGNREVDGVFAGATLTYRETYTLDGSVRRDASSTLPKGNNRYFYPAVSAGIVFSNLIPSLNWLSYGKIRGNYAEVGNDAPYYSVKNTFVSSPLFGSEALYSLPSRSNNPDLKPERNKSWEAGLELSMFKNRIGADVTYYDAKAFDQILSVDISRATGYSGKFFNAGSIENKGWEVTLRGTPLKYNDFSWDVTVNWTRNRNKVIELFNDGAGNIVDNVTLATFQGGVSTNASLGQPYGVIKGNDYTYYGDAKNETRDPSKRIVGSNGRYVKTAASNYIIGDPNPDWTGGISNRFKYKNFSLSFLIDVRKGGDIFSLDMYYGLATGLYPETAGNNDLGNPLRNSIADGGGIIRPGVDASGNPNTVRVEATTYGAFGYRYAPAAGFIYDGSYWKLREASLSYSFPKSMLGNQKVLNSLDLSLVGRNLWIIHKNLPYADPEDIYGSGNGTLGYSGNGYPSTRQITFNVKLGF